MSRPSPDPNPHPPARTCFHVVATLLDGTTRIVGTRASHMGAIGLKSQMKNAKGIVSIDIEPRHWCTCSNQ